MARAVAALLFVFATAIVMNQRSARLLGERQRLSGERASAAEVQSLLLKSMPAVGDSYEIEPVYLPASEVGGDFYQVLQRTQGSLVVVGDVSGKGLRVAMLVSVAVGILRNEKSSSPAAILGALNNGLAGHTGAGFVTCCCARFDPEGTVTIANAGHLAPYCDGCEVEVSAGLPLGIEADGNIRRPQFAGHRSPSSPTASWRLRTPNASPSVSSGDARCRLGRRGRLPRRPKAWGQNDDITVVSVRRIVA